MSGLFLMNSGSLGLSHFAAKLGEQCRARTCEFGARVTSLHATSITSNTLERESNKRRPSDVGSTLRFFRKNSGLAK